MNAKRDAVGWQVEPVIYTKGDTSREAVDRLMADIRRVVVRHGGVVANVGYGHVNDKGEPALPARSTISGGV